MAKFDFELLVVFDEIYTTRNVTRAALNLGLPQSSVSIALGKLRRHFGDRLFSRTADGMAPTPRAQSAIADVRLAIASLQNALAGQPVFDPAASTREFRICLTDISEVVLLPTLLNHLKRVGPGIRVDVSKISPDTPKQLQEGAVDVALGFMPHLEAGFYQHKLFDQNFVCLVGKAHPRIGAELTRERFLEEGHLRVKSSGTGHAIVDKAMAEQGMERNVVLQLPSFLGVARIVAETDLIATVPQRYGEVMASSEPIKLLVPPLTLPDFSVKQHWHERFHEDASNRWLRQTMSALFARAPLPA